MYIKCEYLRMCRNGERIHTETRYVHVHTQRESIGMECVQMEGEYRRRWGDPHVAHFIHPPRVCASSGLEPAHTLCIPLHSSLGAIFLRYPTSVYTFNSECIPSKGRLGGHSRILTRANVSPGEIIRVVVRAAF